MRGQEVTDFAALAIGQYETEVGYYLLYCDADWNAITDTRHDTIERAIQQAQFEFGAVTFVDITR